MRWWSCGRGRRRRGLRGLTNVHIRSRIVGVPVADSILIKLPDVRQPHSGEEFRVRPASLRFSVDAVGKFLAPLYGLVRFTFGFRNPMS